MRPVKYKSSDERLLSLPDVFSLTTLARLSDLPVKPATVYLRRWQTAGLIAKAGPRAGVYFNLRRCGKVTAEMRASALLMEFPSAVLTGESALHAAGWTTQIPSRTTVAALARRTYPRFDGFSLGGRGRDWFRRVHPHVLKPKDADFFTAGLPALPPALALADCFADPKAWHPDVDDLDIPSESLPAIAAAFQLLEVAVPSDLEDLFEHDTFGI